MAEVTSSSGGMVGREPDVRVVRVLPWGKDDPAGVSAMPTSLASETTRPAVPGTTSRLTK